MIKWTSIAFVAILTVKILAFWQRGYLAFGEELAAVAWVVVAYWAVHSEPYLAWREKCRNKRRLKRLAGRVMIR